jgi:hypothetical protein
MSERTLAEIVSTLQTEGLLDIDPAVDQAIDKLTSVQPWYVRTMVGFGAWLASLLLIGFVGGIGSGFDLGFPLFGLAFMAGAVFVRRQSETDFMIQSALALSLAGQALFVWGVMELADWDESKAIFGLAICLNVVLFAIFPDRIHRVISVLLCIGSATMLLYAWELNAAVPLLGPAMAALLIYLHRNHSKIIAAGKGQYFRPLQSGVMLGAFGCLMMSTVYILPELSGSFEFYPWPWISTILFGVMLLYVANSVWADLFSGHSQNTKLTVYGLLVIITACAWLAPGLLLALLVILLGAGSGRKSMTGAGIAFLALFLATYFYGIQITMLQKSATLVAAGLAILIARWVVLHLLPEEPASV